MIRAKPALPPLPSIRLDWRAYFLEFCRLHGGNPVPHKDKLLFRDGWMYSATDYRGPEFPPPKDVAGCRKLVRTYWLTRLALVNRERRYLAEQLQGLEEAARSRSAPLQAWWPGRDDVGKRAVMRGPLDLRAVRDRLELLRADAAACEAKTVEKNTQTTTVST